MRGVQMADNNSYMLTTLPLSADCLHFNSFLAPFYRFLFDLASNGKYFHGALLAEGGSQKGKVVL